MAVAKQLSIRDWLSCDAGKLFFRGEEVGWAHINSRTGTWAVGARMGRNSFTAYGANEFEALAGFAKMMSETQDDD